MGIIITFYPTTTAINAPAIAQVLLGDLYALMAGLAWALSTIIVRLSSLAQAPATQTLFYQLTGCFIFIIGEISGAAIFRTTCCSPKTIHKSTIKAEALASRVIK